MNSEIDLDKKHEFVKWIIECVQLKRSECDLLLDTLYSHKNLLEKIRFVDSNARYAPRGIIVSAKGIHTVPFRYLKRHDVTGEMFSLVRDIENINDIFYFQVNLPQKLKGDEYYSVIEECPYFEYHGDEKDIEKGVIEFINDMEIIGSRRAILEEIDMALDNRDKKKFDKLIEKLRNLHNPFDNTK